MNGSGSVIVDPNATMIISKAFTNSGFTITNNGTVRWTAGNVTLNNGATVNNQAGAVFQVEDSVTLNSTAGAGTFNNYGTFRRLAVAGQPFGATQVQVAFNSLVSPGQPPSTVDVQSAAVQFQGAGTFQATITTAAGTVVEFDGPGTTNTLLDGTAFSGAGTVRVTQRGRVALADNSKVTNSATFEIGGFDPRLPTRMDSGILMGSGVFRNTGTLNWRVGYIVNVLQVDNQGVLTISSEDITDPVQLDSSVLLNESTMTWTLVANNILQITNANPNRRSQIINRGLFDVQNDSTLVNDRNQPGLDFLNQLTGIFQKSAGNRTTTIQPAFTNDGSIQLLGRTVSFAGGVSQSGTALLANGTLLAPWYALNGGWLDLGGTNGTGRLSLSGGTLTIAAGATLRGLGTIDGSVINAGTVNLGAAGAPVGWLMITGDYTQTGTLVLRLQQAQGEQYDYLQIGGTANLGGTLQVTALPGFNPAANDVFQILIYAQEVGDFNRPYTLPPLNAPRTWAAAAPGATDLDLTVQ
jgi:hypothetical protein